MSPLQSKSSTVVKELGFPGVLNRKATTAHGQGVPVSSLMAACDVCFPFGLSDSPGAIRCPERLPVFHAALSPLVKVGGEGR